MVQVAAREGSGKNRFQEHIAAIPFFVSPGMFRTDMANHGYSEDRVAPLRLTFIHVYTVYRYYRDTKYTHGSR